MTNIQCVYVSLQLLLLSPFSLSVIDDLVDGLDRTNIIELPQDELDVILNRENIQFNGKITTLGRIYGDNIQPSISNFRPGRVFTDSSNTEDHQIIFGTTNSLDIVSKKCHGHDYIEREFSIQPQSNYRPLTLSDKDTPTAIATMITEHIGRENLPIVLLNGAMKSGKSVALAKIQHELLEKAPTAWTVHVDLLEILNDNTINEFTLDSIVSKMIDEKFRYLFHNLLELNTRKIVMLFDNIDHMIDRNFEIIISIMEEFNKKGAFVVLTGSQYILNHIIKWQIRILSFEMTELTIPQMEKYLMNIWRDDIVKKLKNIPKYSASDFPWLRSLTSFQTEYLHEYVVAMVQTLYLTPLPRTFVTLQIIADDFASKNTELIGGPRGKKYQVGCIEYVTRQTPLPSELLIVLQRVPLNNMEFYKTYINKFSPRTCTAACLTTNELINYHANLALEETLSKAPASQSPIIEYDHKLTAQVLRKYWWTFDYVIPAEIKLNNYQFTRNDFRDYFAAVKVTQDPTSVPIVMWKKIFTDPHYRIFVDFLNSNPKFLTTSSLRSMALINDVTINRDLLDNLIQNGFNNLFKIMTNDLMLPSSPFTQQFQSYIEGTFRPYYSNIRIFNMATVSYEEHQYPYLFPLHNLVPWSRGRLCHLINQNMIESLEPLAGKVLKFIDAEVNHIALQSALLQPIFNRDTINFITSVINNVYIWPNELLYYSVNNLGDKGISSCEYIMSHYTVNPNDATQHGRTLLHAAVQWGTKRIVEYVVTKLGFDNAIDTADDYGMTIFAMAIDANPSAFYPSHNWWEMMAYLGDHVRDLKLPSIQLNIEWPRDLSSNPWTKIVIPNTIRDIANYRELMLNPSKSYDDSYERMSALIRLTPSPKWGLSLQSSSLRRKIIMQQLDYYHGQVLNLELLLNYGNTQLSMMENVHFQKAIVTFFERQSPTNAEFRRKIFQTIIEQIGNLLTLDNMQYFIDSHVFKKLNSHTRDEVGQQLRRRISRILSDPPIDLQSNAALEQFLRKADELMVKINVQSNENNVKIRKSGVACLNSRYIRSVKSCLYNWNDIDEFNDATTQRRSVREIRVNSEKFIKTLINEETRNIAKAQELIEVVEYLIEQSDINIINGQSRMLVNDVIKYKSLTAYRKHQRLTTVVTDVSDKLRKKSSFRYSSRRMALNSAAALPIIHGMYQTINKCLENTINTTNTNCIIGSSALTLAVSPIPLKYYTPKFIKWAMDSSELTVRTLPRNTPVALKKLASTFLRPSMIKFGVLILFDTLTILPLGFDIYNIVEMSKIIDLCTKQGDECLSKDKIDAIISLTFSCVSTVVTAGLLMSGLGFAVGILVGLSLMLIEMTALGINDVVYYNNEYNTNIDENFRIFFHKIALQPLPSDVEALVRQSNLINNIKKYITKLLHESNDNVVAYGIGLGTFHVNKHISSNSFINMANINVRNGNGLSRVLPNYRHDEKRLCLPKRNINAYYDYPEVNVAEAVYECDNAFVITHKERWDTQLAEKSYIIYNLEFIDDGTIIGSDKRNNVFLIYTSKSTHRIIGGSGNIINTFMIQNEFYRGCIYIGGKKTKNILDLTSITSKTLKFVWINHLRMGIVRFNDDDDSFFYLKKLPTLKIDLWITGRAAKQDIINCMDNIQHIDNDQYSITVDGGGGESDLMMDTLINCENTIIRPFTTIIGMNLKNTLYKIHVFLANINSPINYVNTTAIILPQQSQFMVIFADRPLFNSIFSIIYNISNRTLIWNLRSTDSSNFIISIAPYLSNVSLINETTDNTENLDPKIITCIFIDSYSNITVTPVIQLSSNDDSDNVTIHHFNAFTNINNSNLRNITMHYRDLNSLISDQYNIVIKYTYPVTNETFTFGSKLNERFFIDANTKFLFGHNGHDIYVLNSESSELVIIDNEDEDCASDTLIVLESTCVSLIAEMKSNCCDNSPYDVTLLCLRNTTTNTSEYIRVVLRNYFLDRYYRHLQIYWHDAIYVLLPTHWTHDSVSSEKVEFAVFFSFGNGWQTTTLVLTSGDRNVLFNITDDEKNPLMAYQLDDDVVLTKNTFDSDTSSFVILKKFFSNGKSSMEISRDWLNMKIFIVSDNFDDDEIEPWIFTANDVITLVNTSMRIDSEQKFPDLIKEYTLDFKQVQDHNMIIEHNFKFRHRYYEYGILTIINAEPGEFHAKWQDNGMTLSLCARDICVNIKHWCEPIHRLYRMEFISTLAHRPYVIANLNEIHCQQENFTREGSGYDQIDELNAEFFNAPNRKYLTLDNDESRLLRCIGTIFADNVAGNFTFKMFDFSSIVEQREFIHDNCKALFKFEKLLNVSMWTVRMMLNSRLNIFVNARGVTWEEIESSNRVIKAFHQIKQYCWLKFIFLLSNFNDKFEYHDNFDNQMEDINLSLSMCSNNVQFKT